MSNEVCPRCGSSEYCDAFPAEHRRKCEDCGVEWSNIQYRTYEAITPLPEPLFDDGTVPKGSDYIEKKLGDCLDEAKATICGERQDQYGSPEDSFALVAEYWETYLQDYKACSDPLTPKDIAHMMILFKMARVQGQKPSRDSYVDICGYAAIAADRF